MAGQWVVPFRQGTLGSKATGSDSEQPKNKGWLEIIGGENWRSVAVEYYLVLFFMITFYSAQHWPLFSDLFPSRNVS